MQRQPCRPEKLLGHCQHGLIVKLQHVPLNDLQLATIGF